MLDKEREREMWLNRERGVLDKEREREMWLNRERGCA